MSPSASEFDTYNTADDEVLLAKRTAAWLYRQGFPLDWSSDTPPPGPTQRYLIDLWKTDDSVDEGMSRADVKAWLWSEAGW